MTLTAEKARALREKGQAKNLKKRNSLAKKDIRIIFKMIKLYASNGESSLYIDSSHLCLSLTALFNEYYLANILEGKGYKFIYKDSGYTVIPHMTIEW